MLKRHILGGFLLAVAAGCGMEAVDLPVMPAQAPAAQARESSFPAFIRNSQTVPLKYDNRGRLGRLSLNFKVRFAGLVPDETWIWEINGGEKKHGFNSLMYPAQDGHLYVIDQPVPLRSLEVFYKVGSFNAHGPLREGQPIDYKLDFPFSKRSGAEIAIPWAFLAKGVVFQMNVPRSLGTDREPPFFIVINRGYENRFTPEELERLPIYRSE